MTTSRVLEVSLLAGLLVGPAFSQRNASYGPNQKAAYIDAATAQFVNPGLTITVNSANIAADGTITVVYSLADPKGLPLDNLGVNTPGAITTSFIAAYIPANQSQYVAYTTRTSTGTAIPNNIQAGADSGGTLTLLGSGQYQYIFKTKAPSNFDQTATHSVGLTDRETSAPTTCRITTQAPSTPSCRTVRR